MRERERGEDGAVRRVGSSLDYDDYDCLSASRRQGRQPRRGPFTLPP